MTPSQAIHSIQKALERYDADPFDDGGVTYLAIELIRHIKQAVALTKEVTPLDPPWLLLSRQTPAPEDELFWGLRADGSIDLVYIDHVAGWCDAQGTPLPHSYIARLPPIERPLTIPAPAAEALTEPLGSEIPSTEDVCAACLEKVGKKELMLSPEGLGYVCLECTELLGTEREQAEQLGKHGGP